MSTSLNEIPENETLYCFANASGILAFAKISERGYVSKYGEQTLEELQSVYQDIKLVSYEEYQDIFKTPVKEINKDRFNDMFEVLPPLGLVCQKKSMTFKLMEMYSDNITYIFAEISGRYFEFRDRLTLTHDNIIAKVTEAFPELVTK